MRKGGLRVFQRPGWGERLSGGGGGRDIDNTGNFLARVPLSQAGRQWGIWSGVRERREKLNLVSLDQIPRLNIFSASLSTNYDICARLELSFF